MIIVKENSRTVEIFVNEATCVERVPSGLLLHVEHKLAEHPHIVGHATADKYNCLVQHLFD